MQSCIFICPESISVSVSCSQLKIFRTSSSFQHKYFIKKFPFYFTRFKIPKSLLQFHSLFSFQILSNLPLKCASLCLFIPHILTAFIRAMALISSFLDYGSSYLSGLPDPKPPPLQTHLHAIARLIFLKCHFHLVTVCSEAFNSPLIIQM